ncbi:MAG: shikimate dehydrogenase [Thermodesulfovibrionales bacterium]|nr:shikimate dehydrogenase [Thermodesulfovibrionales bacterium]
MTITGKTKITGLIGYPVEHSLSPLMHNRAFHTLGLDYCYVTFPVEPSRLEDAVKGIRALGLKGVNVTVPHKEAVIKFLDSIDDEAAEIGAVNTIVNKEGLLLGYNTDGKGFMASLNENFVTVKGRRVFLVGAGGAAKAVAYYLSKEAEEVLVYDIDTRKAEALAEGLKKNVKVSENNSAIKDADIIINATPLGLKPDDPAPVETSLLRKGQVVCDLIYKKTKLLKEAELRGCLAIDGLGMLLWQGVFAFELWTGIKPPVEIMRKALLESAN